MRCASIDEPIEASASVCYTWRKTKNKTRMCSSNDLSEAEITTLNHPMTTLIKAAGPLMFPLQLHVLFPLLLSVAQVGT